MAVSILQRPKGYILDTTAVPCDVANSGGFAAFDSAAHGLGASSVIYITSYIEEYNGFFLIDPIGPNGFFIKSLADGSTVEFVQTITHAGLGEFGEYYEAVLTHGWSCVHLPIVYRLTNTRWPTNSVDTAQTISTLNDDLGYARVTLSGSLGTFEDLSFIKISGASNSDFDGVYQILDKLSTTNITLNVAYSTFNGTGLLGATIQLYYGNYNVVVRVYAGINSSHEWTAQKPYELAATLELIPDDDNQVFFSINEILKAYVESKNNLLLGTMPNNIDAWVNFYIEYAEQYDSSNGYTVSTTLSSFTSDLSTFEGTGVNAMLPFKNIHSGNLSEYLMTNSAAKFLTLFSIPVLFSCGDDVPDCYNDISFIIPDLSLATIATLRQQFYLNGVIQSTVDETIDEEGGVIRMPIEANCSYDRVDISLLGGLQLFDEPEFDATGDWLQTSSVLSDWTISGGMAFVTLGGIFNASSESLYQSISDGSGNYRIRAYLTTIDGGAPDDDWQATVSVVFYTGGIGGTQVDSQSLGVLKGAAIGNIPTITYDAVTNVSGSFDTIAILVGLSLPVVDSVTVQLREIFIYPTGDAMSETKQFDIDCGCADQEVRLTWLNYLGGFDYWAFKTETGKAIDILNANETTKNIFPEWPKSYGADADTIRKQTSRESTNRLFFTTQYLTEDQADAVAYIKTSPLVQIINSRTDRRTIIVDTDSFNKYTDNQKLITISFSARYTDNIGSQKV